MEISAVSDSAGFPEAESVPLSSPANSGLDSKAPLSAAEKEKGPRKEVPSELAECHMS